MRSFKTGGVSTCFHCQRQLVRVKDGFISALIADPMGNQVKVHKQCAGLALGHGYTAVKSEVAA